MGLDAMIFVFWMLSWLAFSFSSFTFIKRLFSSLFSAVRVVSFACAKWLQLCPTLCVPWTGACQAPLSMGFYRQEYWSGLPFPSPGDLPDPGIEPRSLPSPALAGGFFTTTPRKPIICISEITDIDNCWRNHNCKLFLFLFPLEVISLGTYDGKLDFKP